MKRSIRPETPRETTYQQLIYWKPTRAEKRLKRKIETENTPVQRILFIGHIPKNKPGDRYYDSQENWDAQRAAIWNRLDEFYRESSGTRIELSLCSGAAGGDLDVVSWVKNKKEREGAANLYISVELPLLKEGFRDYSVNVGVQRQTWNEIYDYMFNKRNREFIFIHEPYVWPYTWLEDHTPQFILRRQLSSSEKAKKRSGRINGDGNTRQYLIDTINRLIRQTKEDRKKGISPKILLADYGGQPQGAAGGTRGGTQEGLAKLLTQGVYPDDIEFIQTGLNPAVEGFRLLDKNPNVINAYLPVYRKQIHSEEPEGSPITEHEYENLVNLVDSNRAKYFDEAVKLIAAEVINENADHFHQNGPRYRRSTRIR